MCEDHQHINVSEQPLGIALTKLKLDNTKLTGNSTVPLGDYGADLASTALCFTAVLRCHFAG